MSSANDPPYPDAGPWRHLQVLLAIERRWSHVLDVYQRALLQRIAEVTVGWNREEFECSLQALLDGLPGKVGPVGISLRQAKRCLPVLVERGLVNTRRRPTGLVFSVNVPFVLAEWETVALPPKLATPKRLRQETAVKCLSGPSEVPVRPIRSAQQAHQKCLSGPYKDTHKSSSNSDHQISSEAGLSPDRYFSDFEEDREGSEVPPETSSPALTAREIVARKTIERIARKESELEIAVSAIRAADPKAKGKAALQTKHIRTAWEHGTNGDALPWRQRDRARFLQPVAPDRVLSTEI